MIEALILGAGMVLVFEGLVLALAPSRLEDLIAALAEIGPEARRLLGLACIALGVLVVAVTLAVFRG